MRSLLLSLKPEVYNTILSGDKIYEHRRVFPNEPIKAYIYISRPIQAISGIMYLGNRVRLEEWKSKYNYDPEAVNRINQYMEHHKVAMEIQKFQETSAIQLEIIKQKYPNFLIPQMYYYLDSLPLLYFLEENLKPIGSPILHSFENITSDLICIH